MLHSFICCLMCKAKIAQAGVSVFIFLVTLPPGTSMTPQIQDTPNLPKHRALIPFVKLVLCTQHTTSVPTHPCFFAFFVMHRFARFSVCMCCKVQLFNDKMLHCFICCLMGKPKIAQAGVSIFIFLSLFL